MARLNSSFVLSLLFASRFAEVAQAKATRRYNFTITNQWSADDGHGRPVFAINGQTPGPLIEAEEGDEIEVFLDNQLAFETTMHWYVAQEVEKALILESVLKYLILN